MLNVFLSTDDPACAGMDVEVFFPVNGDDNGIAMQSVLPTLRKVCAGCSVIDKCREWAIPHEQHGFWGGMSAHERKMYRRKHNIPLDQPWAADYLKGIRDE